MPNIKTWDSTHSTLEVTMVYRYKWPYLASVMLRMALRSSWFGPQCTSGQSTARPGAPRGGHHLKRKWKGQSKYGMRERLAQSRA